jgi:DNA-directed RNA polymerase specialized sigma24 family protein
MTPLLAQRPRLDRGFERIYRRHLGDVYRYALAVLRDPADAEHVAQTTFLNAYRAYTEQGHRPQSPQNWLIAIAHEACRHQFPQSDDFADSSVEHGMPLGADIRYALSRLAFDQRAALVMRELEGRSYAEIAEVLELSSSAVETLMFRARRALREQLDGALSCGEAQFAVSRQLDGRLPRRQRGQLRAHVKKCADCASFARRLRAQHAALKTLELVPVPASLTSLLGGRAALSSGIALKAAAAVTAGLGIGGAGYEGVQHAPGRHAQPVAVALRQLVVPPEQTTYAGDAGVAARHVKVTLPPNSHAEDRLQVRVAPVARPSDTPPGPFDTGLASQKP